MVKILSSNLCSAVCAFDADLISMNETVADIQLPAAVVADVFEPLLLLLTLLMLILSLLLLLLLLIFVVEILELMFVVVVVDCDPPTGNPVIELPVEELFESSAESLCDSFCCRCRDDDDDVDDENCIRFDAEGVRTLTLWTRPYL